MTARFLSIILILTAVPLSGQVSTGMNDALDWLVSSRNADGSWGQGDQPEIARDTTAAAIVMATYRPEQDLVPALGYLDGVSTQTLDGVVARGHLTWLALGDTDKIFLPVEAYPNLLYDFGNPRDQSGFNAPEGGWGLAKGFQTNTLDTVLALELLAATTSPGLRVANETAAPGATLTYRVELPEAAVSRGFTVSTAGAALSLRFATDGPPDASAPTYTIQPGATNSLPADGFDRRQLWISVSTTAPGTAAVFGLRLRFDGENELGVPFFDGLDYLLAAQNPDGGWGLHVGDTSNPYLTARVLAAFDALREHFKAPAATTAGANFLATLPNPDGGFGTGGSDVATTAFAYHALSAFAPASPARAAARTYLLSQQDGNGSWKDDAHATAVSVLALGHEFRDVDSDGDGVPDIFDDCPGTVNPDQSDSDLDGLGDPCDPDADNDGLDNATEIALGTDPFKFDSVIPGIADGDLDLSLDGRTGREAVDAGLDPLQPRPQLAAGLNFFTYPVEAPAGFSAYDLLAQLGGPSAVTRVQRYDPGSGQYLAASYLGANPAGSDFPIAGGDGLAVTMIADGEIPFPGPVSYRRPELHAGPNLVRFPDLAPGATIFDLFARITETIGRVISIQRIDPATGRLVTFSSRLGSPATPRFPVRASETYLVHMDWVTPRFVITYPADGQMVTESPITVTGEVAPEVTSVVVNGVIATLFNGTFSAPGIGLVDGTNTIDALAEVSPEIRSTRSLTVLLGEEADFTIAVGGPAANGSATVTAAPALIAQVAGYLQQISGSPSGLNFATTSAGILGNSVNFNYAISASPSLAPGTYEITVTYLLRDSGGNTLSPVSGNVIPLRILVTP